MLVKPRGVTSPRGATLVELRNPNPGNLLQERRPNRPVSPCNGVFRRKGYTGRTFRVQRTGAGILAMEFSGGKVMPVEGGKVAPAPFEACNGVLRREGCAGRVCSRKGGGRCPAYNGVLRRKGYAGASSGNLQWCFPVGRLCRELIERLQHSFSGEAVVAICPILPYCLPS